MDSGEIENALALFLESALREPHFKTYELLGECCLRLRRLSEAIPFLAAASALNRGVRASALLAETWLALGRPVEAVEAADLALSRDPHNRLAKRIKETATTKIKI